MSDSDEFEDQQEFFFGEYDGERNEAGERSVFLIFRKKRYHDQGCKSQA